MCDPATALATANMLNAVGTATGISTLSASTAIAGFSNTALSQGIGTGLSILRGPVGSLGLSLLSANAERTRAGYEAAQARYQQQQYKEEIERQRLEQLQQENERKRRFAREFSSNQAIAAASGVDIASASYQALFASNRETYLKDRDAISMNSLDEIVRSRQNLQLAKAKEQQAVKTGKTNVAVKVAEGLLRTKQIFDEM